ncbi:hypothetical protein HYFRA_00007039 [Hymenoscyphus fraxineus]|uniref:Uncharacterized protein n=1 Tax=Hymenoscyphus fraxineus TaxID=746836 RepID=A0A9N9PTB6_9HELO|nr:hypothetical protein HYFRA_00007039 [Hymenoscyphus fraxineus]
MEYYCTHTTPSATVDAICHGHPAASACLSRYHDSARSNWREPLRFAGVEEKLEKLETLEKF